MTPIGETIAFVILWVGITIYHWQVEKRLNRIEELLTGKDGQ